MADNPLNNPQDFLAWKANPLTQGFLQYLTDYRLQMAMLWAEGQPMTPQQQAQAEVMGDLASLSCNDVRQFYGLEEGENDER